VASVAEQLAGKEPQTQFGRAMAQLGVKLILARSPQVKGRVERMNGVLQDRLVKALRLEQINALEPANRYLERSFLPAFNRQFARPAAQAVDAHLPVPRHLDEVLSWEAERVVQRDWTVVWDGQWYQLDRQHEGLSLAGRKVIVRRLRDGREQLVHRGQKLRWRRLAVRPERARLAVRPVAKAQPETSLAAAEHPWRRFGAAAGRKYWAGRRPNPSQTVGAPIRAGGAGPLRGGDRRRRELGLESRRRRPPARSNRRRGQALRTASKEDISS
jgi:hypothetical protein